MSKTAFITGVSGQDGYYLSACLLRKGYDVHGLRLYSATSDLDGWGDVGSDPNFHLHFGDLTDGGNLTRLIQQINPDEIYNLGAQSHVKVSFDVPEATTNINALGTLRLLEAMRHSGRADTMRFYQASSSEMFGNQPSPQTETTPFTPCSPYGAAKLYAYWMARNYREAYGLHISNGILFNHESPRRGHDFVTRKISRSVAMISAGKLDTLAIGNMYARRDWGHAADYVDAMWRMLQQPEGDDYVVATGRAHSVKDFIEAAFEHIGIELSWQGEGVEETGRDTRTGRVLVKVDPQFFRPQELRELTGDSRKAREVLGWKPQVSFSQLVADMVGSDLAGIKEGQSNAKDWLHAAE